MNPASRYSLEMKLRPQRRKPLLSLLAALLLITASCGSETDQSAEPTSNVLTSDGPEWGASLDEFLEEIDSETDSEGDSETESSSAPPEGFKEIQWENLIPPGSSDEEIYARFDERIAEVEPGTPEADAVYEELQSEYDNQPVNPEIAGEAIQLAGFVAPLTYSGELVTEFLLVPYFGACIHVPPPPPNQTIMVSLDDGQGLTVEDSWGAVWVTGSLTIEGADTDLAKAGYTITGAQTGPYDDY